MDNTIFITGAGGFVGQNLLKALSPKFNFIKFVREREITVDSKIFIHLAGKAHDLKNVSKPDEYYKINTQLSKKVFDAFLLSNANVFIMLSSVKAVADEFEGELREDYFPIPLTHYGKSKLLAEQYVLSKKLPEGKRLYILRPCMIHGPKNKGNLNLLYNFVCKGIPWPLGAFNNQRSFCSIDNLLFIINELIKRQDIPSGVYNVADDLPLSTNEVIALIAKSQNKKARILKLSKLFIIIIAKLGDIFKLPLNTERLGKLTKNYIVSNHKLVKAIGKELPVTSSGGMMKTLSSFYK